MFYIIYSRKSHAYILVSVYTGEKAGGFRLVWKHAPKQSDILIAPSHVIMREAMESREGVGSNTGHGVWVGRDTATLFSFSSYQQSGGGCLAVLWAGPQIGALWATEQPQVVRATISTKLLLGKKNH